MNKKLRVILAIVLCVAMVFALVACAGADGAAGPAGADGKSAYQIWLTADGNAGKTEAQFIEWLKGATGAAGTNGTNGADGKSAYEIWLTAPDNAGKTQTEFIEWLKGATGAPGAAGKDGTNGTNGENGRNAANRVSPADQTASFDYYVDTYGVPTNHVFRTISHMDLNVMLSVANSGTNRVAAYGKFAIVFGGAWDKYTAAMMQYINTSAKAQGIESVFVLDTKLDSGLSGDIVGTISGATGTYAKYNGQPGYTSWNGSTIVYNRDIAVAATSGNTSTIAGLFNTASNATALLLNAEKTVTQTGLLMVVDIPRLPTGTNTRNTDALKPSIVASYINSTIDAAGKLNASFAEKTKIDLVLSKVAASKGEGYFDAYAFRTDRVVLQSVGVTPEAENQKYVVSITYAELIALLEAPGDHIIMWGGYG